MNRQRYFFAKGCFIYSGREPLSEAFEGFQKELPYIYQVEAGDLKAPVPPYENPVSFNGACVAPSEDGFVFFSGNPSQGTEGRRDPATALYVNRDYSQCIRYGLKPVTENETGISLGEERSGNAAQTGSREDTAESGTKRFMRELVSAKIRDMDYLRMIFDGVLPYNGGSVIHASCVKCGGRAVLFAAPSGGGKSTQARLWRERFGALILSSDAPAVFPEKDGVCAYGMPWDGSDRVMIQDQAMVAAIVELRKAKRNSVRRLSPGQGFRLLMKQGHLPLWDDHAMFQEMAVLRRIAGRVPFYRLNCLPDTEAAELAYQVIYEHKMNQVMEVEDEMKIKEGFVLRDIMDEKIVLPKGKIMRDFKGAVILNETSAFAWEKLQTNITRDDLLHLIVDEFDVEEEMAGKDLDNLLAKLRVFGVLEDLPA